MRRPLIISHVSCPFHLLSHSLLSHTHTAMGGHFVLVLGLCDFLARASIRLLACLVFIEMELGGWGKGGRVVFLSESCAKKEILGREKKKLSLSRNFWPWKGLWSWMGPALLRPCVCTYMLPFVYFFSARFSFLLFFFRLCQRGMGVDTW